ncbi:MAG: hypothetical protein ACXABY_07585 [Candidatus Thorarchaeota archaeon]
MDKRNFVKEASKLGVNKEKALQLYEKLNREDDKRVKGPKLRAVLNPNSKYYDGTPKLTNSLSLLFFTHQQRHSRLRHKRITKSDRQWVHLVQIKQRIVETTGKGSQAFMTFSKQLFNESERMSRGSGKKNLYLAFVASRLEELIDCTSDYLTSEVTKKEQRVWKAYVIRRKRITGVSLPKKLEPGSDEHDLAKRILRIAKRYKASVNQFMDIQFASFKAVGSFPRLKNLVTSAAIDRLEQGMLKIKEEASDEKDEAYWKDVRGKISRQSKRKANRR